MLYNFLLREPQYWILPWILQTIAYWLILGKMGLLLGKNAICYPGFEAQLEGATISDERVVLDGNILTAAGMGAALDMGIEIVRIFCGDEKANALRSAVIAD
jgi:4-methyl-5(b-hydroxyethyl)-thiazole monophosphate biosynthesis